MRSGCAPSSTASPPTAQCPNRATTRFTRRRGESSASPSIGSIPRHRHRHLGQPTLNVGSLHGGLNVNSVPDRAEAAIDIRTVPGQSNESITADIAALLESADVSPMVDVDAVATDPQNEWISDVFDLFRDADGRSPDPRGAPFFTDASVLTSALGNVPTVILGPGETAMAHKTDEYCLIPKIEASVALYSEIARRWVAA